MVVFNFFSLPPPHMSQNMTIFDPSRAILQVIDKNMPIILEQAS